jgi:hypothetical protein
VAEDITSDRLRDSEFLGFGRPRMPQIMKCQVVNPCGRDRPCITLLDISDWHAGALLLEGEAISRRVSASGLEQGMQLPAHRNDMRRRRSPSLRNKLSAPPLSASYLSPSSSRMTGISVKLSSSFLRGRISSRRVSVQSATLNATSRCSRRPCNRVAKARSTLTVMARWRRRRAGVLWTEKTVLHSIQSTSLMHVLEFEKNQREY